MKILPIIAIAGLAAYGYRRYWKQERPGTRGVATPPTDEQLAEQIRSRVRDAGGTTSNFRLRVENGILHLDGRVSSAERDLVLRHGLAVEGIRSVDNRLEITDQAPQLSQQGVQINP